MGFWRSLRSWLFDMPKPAVDDRFPPGMVFGRSSAPIKSLDGLSADIIEGLLTLPSSQGYLARRLGMRFRDILHPEQPGWERGGNMEELMLRDAEAGWEWGCIDAGCEKWLKEDWPKFKEKHGIVEGGDDGA